MLPCSPRSQPPAGVNSIALFHSPRNRAGVASRVAWQTAGQDGICPYAIESGTVDMPAMIQPKATFKENLQQMPSVYTVQRVDLIDGNGTVVASIENQPGKQGSLAVYHYLKQVFGKLDARAAEHGLVVFAEHGGRPQPPRRASQCRPPARNRRWRGSAENRGRRHRQVTPPPCARFGYQERRHSLARSARFEAAIGQSRRNRAGIASL